MPDADFFTNEAFKNWFKELNDMIVNELDGSKNSDAINRQIGHAYFKKDSTMSNVKSIIQYDIIPLLKEYFYEKPEAFERLNEHLGKVQ